MPRYYFHIADGQVFLDETGTELPGLSEARSHAVATAGAMLRDVALKEWSGSEWRLTTVDSTGACVLRLRFSAEGIKGFGPELPRAEVQSSIGQLSRDEVALVLAFRQMDDDIIQGTVLELLTSMSGEGREVRPALKVVSSTETKLEERRNAEHASDSESFNQGRPDRYEDREQPTESEGA